MSGAKVTYSAPAATNVSTMPPTLWYDDVTVTVDRHVYSGVLADGSRIDHQCDGQNCRLPEEIIEAECRMRRARMSVRASEAAGGGPDERAG